jgi:hypothetical protein
VKTKHDSRREERRPVDIKATISVDGRAVPARTRDISRSGICLLSDTEIPCDTELQIQLVLSLGIDKISEPLMVTGRTIWCTAMFGRYQIGVIFVQIDGNRRRFLDLFMRFVDGEVNPVGHDPTGDQGDRPRPVEDKDDPFRP